MTDRTREKLAELRAALRAVDDNLPDTLDEFTTLGIVKDGIYKNVETAIQTCYDICARIVKEADLGVPMDETALPDMLADGGIITDELADTLKDMKGFRNALAHRYGTIDDEEAYQNITQGRDDFDRFIDQIESYLDQ